MDDRAGELLPVIIDQNHDYDYHNYAGAHLLVISLFHNHDQDDYTDHNYALQSSEGLLL